MKIAHLILAHTAPEQLTRLVKRLWHEDASFFIHLDSKADIALFSELAAMAQVTFVQQRVNVKWGAYSIVQATINGFKEISASGQNFDFVNLLSGADYPLLSTQYVHDFFSANQGKNFMHFLRVADEWTEAVTRLTQYHLTLYSFPAQYRVQGMLNKLLPTRKMPNGLIPVGRSQWFTITSDAMRYIIDYLDNNKNVVRFFRLTWAPDEIIFQTVLYNSPFRDSMVNDNLVYVDWSAKQASPKTLDMEDKALLMPSGKLFARKFDMKTKPQIMDYLDEVNK